MIEKLSWGRQTTVASQFFEGARRWAHFFPLEIWDISDMSFSYPKKNLESAIVFERGGWPGKNQEELLECKKPAVYVMWAMKKTPGCLGYIGDYTAQLFRVPIKQPWLFRVPIIAMKKPWLFRVPIKQPV